MTKPVVFCWSGGKDSALALDALGSDREYEVVSLLTTLTRGYDRITMHGVRRSLLLQQVAALGLPLDEVWISPAAANAEYETQMEAVLRQCQARGIDTVAFGDIFLADLREYREKNLARLGMQAIFPIWRRDSTELIESFRQRGFKARLACVDAVKLGRRFSGREIDANFLSDLPAGVDPCGENGEYHSFVYDGPLFRTPIALTAGEIVEREGRFYIDLLPGTAAA